MVVRQVDLTNLKANNVMKLVNDDVGCAKGEFMRKFLKYLITFVVCGVIALLVCLGKQTFGKTGLNSIYGDLSDAFFIPGILSLCLGALVFATNGGAFDMLGFGVKKLFDLFKKDLTKVKYRTFYDYHKAQQEKKRSFAYLLIVGALFVAAAVVFFALYMSTKTPSVVG